MKRGAVSSVIGAVLLIVVAVSAMAIVTLVLLSGPLPTKVPSISAVITNRSNTVYISHEGGDSLPKGQYKILVDGADETSNFDKSFTDPWSAGKIMNYTLTSPYPPSRVVMIYTGAGGGGTVLFTADLTALVTIPPFLPSMPVVAWSNLPSFGNTTTTFHFTDSSTGRNVTGYFWNFNEGSPSNAKNPDHTFASCGNDYCQYHINHSATDSPGTPWSLTAWLNRTWWVTVYKADKPTATFTQNVTGGMVPFAVKFTATPSGAIRVDDWYWTFGDGGTSTSQNPEYTYTSGGTYTVTLKASNYTLGYATVTGSIRANVTASPTWYNCAWGYRKNITIFNKSVSGTLSSFPVLIGLASDGGLGAHAIGKDILFTKSDGVTVVPYEIEKFTSPSGALAAWVNVESLSASAPNVTLYMYYGSDSNGPENAADVWDNSYKGVWHLNQSGSGVSGEFKDSNGVNHGTGGAGAACPTLTQSGPADGGQSFDGSNDYMDLSSSITLQPPTLTVSYWIKRTGSWSNIQRRFIWAKGSSETGNGWYLDTYDTSNQNQPINLVVDGNNGFSVMNADPDTYYPLNAWTYMVITFRFGNPGTCQMYKNGTSQSVDAWNNPRSISQTSDTKYVATTPSSGPYLQGVFDEIRISNNQRSSDWSKTEYNNQGEPSKFHYLMAQEENPSPC